MNLNIVILIGLVAAGLWTVLSRSLIRAAIGLAITSAILTIIMFRLDSPLAAVFELSVCAGLIPVLFISMISLTQAQTGQEKIQMGRERLAKFAILPVIVICLGIGLLIWKIKFDPALPAAETQTDARIVLWHLRQMDLVGQLIILITGVLGIVVFFKEEKK